MTTEDISHEIERQPFVPLRLHLSSGQRIDVLDPHTAWVRQNIVLVVHPLEKGSARIGNYDVVSLRLIERIEQINQQAIS